MIDWKPFLARWSKELMQSDLSGRVEPPPESADWLGFAPASEQDIEKLERRLGMLLPPSYRSFLLTTNGWRRTTAFIERVRPASDVEWFRVENEEWVDIYSEEGWDVEDKEYYEYEEGCAAFHRAEHMASLLQISDVDDGVYLLNPEAVTPDGEWEAWFFANWVPGARRYPSFAHMIVREYRSFALLAGVAVSQRDLPTLPTVASDVPRMPAKRNPAKRRKKPPEKSPDFEGLIEQMRSADKKVCAKAVREICGKLRGRPIDGRRPDLVPKFVELFYSSYDASVRRTCISALTEFADKEEPPAPLFDALSDADPGVVLTGIHALTYFPDDRAVEPLCRFIESRENALFNENAMQALAEMHDERAIPTLAGVLLDTDNEFDQSFGTAAFALGQFGEAAFDVLASAANHADARIRFAAVVGLDISGDERAAKILDRCESDPDPKVQQRARVRMGRFRF